MLSQFVFSCADGSDDTTVDEQVGACDEPGMFAKQEGCCLGNLVARTCALGGRGINHALIAFAVGVFAHYNNK